MAFPNDYRRRCPLVIPASQLSGTLSGFPVLLTDDNLPSEMFDADGLHPAQNGGGDLRFSTDPDGGTRLPCEVVTFVTDNDPANGSAEIWVSVPTLSSSSDNTIYVWYDSTVTETQPARDDTYGSESVWDDDYLLVLHFQEDPGTTPDGWKDSTQYHNDGTGAGDIGSPDGRSFGKFSRSAYFYNPNVQYIDIGTDWVYGPNQLLNMTVTRWLYQTGAFAQGCLSWGETDGDGLGAETDTHDISNDDQNGSYVQPNAYLNRYDARTAFGTMSFNQWHYKADRITNKRTSTPDVKLWYDTLTTAGSAKDAFTLGASNSHFRIGAAFKSNFRKRAWLGYIDEFRVSKVGRSDEWIEAEYNSQSSPATFVIDGTPVDVNPTGLENIQVIWIPGI